MSTPHLFLPDTVGGGDRQRRSGPLQTLELDRGNPSGSPEPEEKKSAALTSLLGDHVRVSTSFPAVRPNPATRLCLCSGLPQSLFVYHVLPEVQTERKSPREDGFGHSTGPERRWLLRAGSENAQLGEPGGPSGSRCPVMASILRQESARSFRWHGLAERLTQICGPFRDQAERFFKKRVIRTDLTNSLEPIRSSIDTWSP